MSVSTEVPGVRPYKLGIVGAGAVGSALAYASLIRGSARIISLYDINPKKVDAEVEDLTHGSMFTPSEVMGGADPEVLRDSTIIIITAGAAQKPGQTRLELAEVNAKIISDMMPTLLGVAPDATYVIVTNPCDVLTVVAQQVSGLPSSRVFSTGTLLDTSRLRSQLAERAGVSESNVHAYVVGEHGDSEFPSWSNAHIANMPLRDWEVGGVRVFTDAILDELAESVRTAAYRVIEGKGATNYAIGLTGSYLVESLLSTTRRVLPLSSVLDDYFGVSGVALSVPCLIGGAQIVDTVHSSMTASEIRQFRESADAVRATLRSIGH
ncbi:L-lactate dehydrogenase [Propioniciclava sp. MC1683]|uniref:L-lactate dehydrogenase n=1 Tax=Propioniciclava sp. MC1683 TaxID=2760309 RepID=UPI0015FF116D|nr:L-lactate dehydrogenase [Propioniciclava sp. MC1683]MBB1502057.1 L-lactate dehydrogenase [Propioniciclava sp. MC1683]